MTPEAMPADAGSVTQDDALLIGKDLEALPQKPKVTLTAHDVVALNRAAIRAALQKGYSYSDVAKIFVSKGVKISASTLAHYMREKDKTAQADVPPRTKVTEPHVNAPATAQPPRPGYGPERPAQTQLPRNTLPPTPQVQRPTV